MNKEFEMLRKEIPNKKERRLLSGITDVKNLWEEIVGENIEIGMPIQKIILESLGIELEAFYNATTRKMLIMEKSFEGIKNIKENKDLLIQILTGMQLMTDISKEIKDLFESNFRKYLIMKDDEIYLSTRNVATLLQIEAYMYSYNSIYCKYVINGLEKYLNNFEKSIEFDTLIDSLSKLCGIHQDNSLELIRTYCTEVLVGIIKYGI